MFLGSEKCSQKDKNVRKKTKMLSQEQNTLGTDKYAATKIKILSRKQKCVLGNQNWLQADKMLPRRPEKDQNTLKSAKNLLWN